MKKSFEDNKRQKVSSETVEYIRSMKGKIRQVDLAKEVGLSQPQISAIQKFKFHIGDEDSKHHDIAQEVGMSPSQRIASFNGSFNYNIGNQDY